MQRNKLVCFDDKNKIPMIGLGTWQLDKEQTYGTLLNAIKLGYRLFDCAELYGNESHIGNAFKSLFQQNIISRQSLFIVSKIWSTHLFPHLIIPTLKKQLKSLNMEYLDLYLIHGPVVDQNVKNKLYPEQDITFLDSWKAMEKAVKLGLVKNIGVSNFNANQIQRILNICSIKPTVNQCECHPYIYKQQRQLIQYCKSKNIIFQGYSPFGCAEKDGPLFDENIQEMAKKYKKSVAQILLKFCVQNNIPTVFKSTQLNRLKNNIEINDFMLAMDDMNKLIAMDRNWRYVWNDSDKNHKEYPFAPRTISKAHENEEIKQEEKKENFDNIDFEAMDKILFAEDSGVNTISKLYPEEAEEQTEEYKPFLSSNGMPYKYSASLSTGVYGSNLYYEDCRYDSNDQLNENSNK